MVMTTTTVRTGRVQRVMAQTVVLVAYGFARKIDAQTDADVVRELRAIVADRNGRTGWAR